MPPVRPIGMSPRGFEESEGPLVSSFPPTWRFLLGEMTLSSCDRLLLFSGILEGRAIILDQECLRLRDKVQLSSLLADSLSVDENATFECSTCCCSFCMGYFDSWCVLADGAAARRRFDTRLLCVRIRQKQILSHSFPLWRHGNSKTQCI